jgi:hypothetical protein
MIAVKNITRSRIRIFGTFVLFLLFAVYSPRWLEGEHSQCAAALRLFERVLVSTGEISPIELEVLKFNTPSIYGSISLSGSASPLSEDGFMRLAAIGQPAWMPGIVRCQVTYWELLFDI